ncbi:hypothetical protein [Mesoterricola silvestris]|uniref:Uncharacterized protein n=1 Tax=Mesoterricola silvestris TaxID=2927979 RepID=A0AA48GK74_9BACT|nr:hypothetical protein [Mesoterricola silvestris]BDU72714.1 hypothetical protein METEAL_18880 [Mesoterricola silvestris]
MSLRLMGCLFGITALGLSAAEVAVYCGSSTLRRGALQSTTLGSIQQRPHREGTAMTGRATFTDAAGKASEVPCEVEVYPGGGDQGDAVVWRVEVPLGTALRSLKVGRGSQVVASLATPRDLPAPAMDFFDAANGQDVSVGWVLTRSASAGASSIWLRWSWDDGATWAEPGKLIQVEAGTGQLDLARIPQSPAGGTLLEFWVPQGLGLSRFRHRVPGAFRPQ